MDTKTQLSEISSINLNEIMDDQEFKQLLNQKRQEFEFEQNLLHDQSKHSLIDELQSQNKSHNSFQVFEVKKKNPQIYNSQTVMKERKLMELAYERSMRPGKLLSNPIFKVEQTQQNQSGYYGTDEDKNDYYAQYLKWKEESDPKNKNNSKKRNQVYYKNILQSIKDTSEPFQKSNCRKQQSSYDADQLNAQIKKIHQQYLQKVTKATSKDLFPQRIDLSQIQSKAISNLQKGSDKNHQKPTPISSSRLNEVKHNQSPESIKKVTNEQTQTRPPKFQQSDINEYCFENMIKRKPDFVSFKNTKNQPNSSVFEKKQKITKIDIQQDYLFLQKNASRLSNPKSTQSSRLSQSNLTHITTSNHPRQINPLTDPYYQQLKQIIKNGYKQQKQQAIIRQKQIDKNHKNQIPTNQPPTKIPAVRLNVQKLLKLPYKQFIVFFDQNHRKIVSMTQPQEYKRLQAYQVKCLQHAESINKLRERFSSEEGARLIGRLSAQQKEKLFKVLYQNQQP